VTGGRPRGELTPARRRELVRLVRKMRRLELEAEHARLALARAAAVAHGEGASVRSIGDAITLGAAGAHRLVATGRALEGGGSAASSG
jgi:hypothetical protein